MRRRSTLALAGVVAMTTAIGAAMTAGTYAAPSGVGGDHVAGDHTSRGGSAEPAQAVSWDFNGDGYPDLAVPASSATVEGHESAGAIGIFSGTEDGPTADTWQRLDQALDTIPGDVDKSRGFGSAFASGDFDGDGYADLAICLGGSRDDVTTGLTVVFGGPDGLTEAIAVPDAPICVSRFIDVADADGNGYDDIFVSGRQLHLARGGPDARDADSWRVEVIFEPDEAEGGGGDLAVGDVTGNGYADVVFVTLDLGLTRHANLVTGGPDGFEHAHSWRFGEGDVLTVAVGDLDGDGHDDVVIGDPEASDGGELNAGIVEVRLGTAGDIEGQEPIRISQSTEGIPGSSERLDQFGQSIAVGNTTGDSYAELAIGVRGEDLGDAENAGRVVVVPGGDSGPNPEAAYELHRDLNEFDGHAVTGDAFGAEVAYRPVDGDGNARLLIAGPGERSGEGRVHLVGDLDTEPVRRFRPSDAEIDPVGARFGT